MGRSLLASWLYLPIDEHWFSSRWRTWPLQTSEEDIFQTLFRETQKIIPSQKVANTWHKNCLKGGSGISVSACPAGCIDLQKVSLKILYTARDGRSCYHATQARQCMSITSPTPSQKTAAEVQQARNAARVWWNKICYHKGEVWGPSLGRMDNVTLYIDNRRHKGLALGMDTWGTI